MKTTYSVTDAQQNLPALMQAASTGTPVKIETTAGKQQGAVLLSEARWTAIQRQLAGQEPEDELHHRQDFYRAWGRL
ncbi:hypothetical protein [Levilactobacillus parabrevis]|uniref:hypothetical protein n=1 Tax=Levilactobacillus parabrevis TaxID=357278 RepID=UPI003756CF5A